MGSGKSTYLMIMLYHMHKRRITIVLPSRKNADDIHRSISSALKNMKESKAYSDLKFPSIGYAIEGKIVEGDIMVVTPYYV